MICLLTAYLQLATNYELSRSRSLQYRMSGLVTCRLTSEKDASERDSRDKETKLLNLTRQLEELRDRLTESERLRTQQQRELDDLTSSQDDAGKNVRSLHFEISLQSTVKTSKSVETDLYPHMPTHVHTPRHIPRTAHL